MARRPRPDDLDPADGQGALIPRPPVRRGRVERAVDDAARRARAAGTLTDTSGALVTAARSCARMVDQAEVKRDAWAHAANHRELRETLKALGWVPTEGPARDPFDAFLDGLGAPELPHPAQP